MKRTIKVALAVVVFALGMLLMISCSEKTDDSGVISAAINEKDRLVVAFADGRIETVAEIVDGDITVPEDAEIKVEVSSRGFWVIDGKKTSIKAKASNGEFIKTNLNDFEFTLKDGTYSVKAGENFNGENIILPENYRGVPVTEIESGAFYNTKQLKSVIIPNSVKTLDKRCFEGCSNLSAVYLGEGVEKIYEYAFKNCEELSRIVIGKNIETIFDTAFLNCEKLEFVNINNIVKWCNVLLNAQPFNVQVEKYTGSPFAYGADLYQYGKKVENFVLPSEPLYVGNSIFENCTSIKTLTVPSISAIGGNSFRGCTSLTDVKIERLDSFGEGLFENCTALENVELGENITNIPMNAFKGCVKLKNIDFPETVFAISDSAFEDCDSLEAVTLAGNIMIVENGAFRGCDALKTVTFGEMLKFVNVYAFLDCNSLSTVNYLGSEEQWNGLAIEEGNEPILAAKKVFNYKE